MGGRTGLRRRAMAAICVVTLALAACGGDDDATTSTAATPAPDAAPPATSAPPTMAATSSAESSVSLEEAAGIVDLIAATFDDADFSPIEELLGDDGTWVAISGDTYDRDTIAEFLEGFGSVTKIVREDESSEGLGGLGFELTETFTSGDTATFWIFVTRDDDGALTITERVRPPR